MRMKLKNTQSYRSFNESTQAHKLTFRSEHEEDIDTIEMRVNEYPKLKEENDKIKKIVTEEHGVFAVEDLIKLTQENEKLKVQRNSAMRRNATFLNQRDKLVEIVEEIRKSTDGWEIEGDIRVYNRAICKYKQLLQECKEEK